MRHTRDSLAALASLVLASTAAAQVPSVIRVEIDYMEDAFHSHRPSQEMLDAMVQVFACHNISLELVVSEAIPHVTFIQCATLPENFWTCTGTSSFFSMKDTFADQGKLLGWHYCIFGHQYNDGGDLGSSGYAEGHDDLIVSLGAFPGQGTPFQIASTFVHELGHNLGLGHGSPLSTNRSGPYAPNYASVMSYRYQIDGIRSGMEAWGLVSSAHLFKEIDYSNGRLPDLIEASLSESDGMDMRAVDWDCSGTISGTAGRNLDLDSDWCEEASDGSRLDDYNDWLAIRDTTFQASPPPGTEGQYESCISADEYLALRAQLPDAPSANSSLLGGPTLTVEPCVSGQMMFVDASAAGGTGSGSSPFRTVQDALSGTPDSSVLYFQSGTYTAGGSALLIDRPLILAGPGSAVIDP